MTDKQLHDEILAELEYEPEVHPERIGVSVENGVVNLSGHVRSYSQKLAAERVVKRVYSARGVVNGLEVWLPSRDEVTDAELGQTAVRILDALSTVPRDGVRVTVRAGHLLLEGLVAWHYQALAAETALHHLRGVQGVTNHIRVREAPTPEAVQTRIATAPGRCGQPNGGGITVEAADNTIILRGSVSCARGREEAELAAWRAPGVTAVQNHLALT